VTPEEIKALRKELACTARELATVLGVDQATVFAWERSELFPTKQYVDRMAALRAKGPSGIPRKPRPAARSRDDTPSGHESPMRALADPLLWQIVRKLIAHEGLWSEVVRLAAGYSDPAESSPSASSPSSPKAPSPAVASPALPPSAAGESEIKEEG
jgi:transcriptional regulator with XRE-family HTH domain